MKKGEKAANEAIAHEMRCEAKAIIERALKDCHNLGVKVFFDDPPSYGSAGCHMEIDASSLDYVADIRKAKALRKLTEGAYQFS